MSSNVDKDKAKEELGATTVQQLSQQVTKENENSKKKPK